MCGIAGIIDPSLTSDEIRPIVRQMTEVIVHRGPDDDGFFVNDKIGLGMRRLSIIDVAHGKQPLTNEDGRVQVILNGEIYNHSDLRDDLKSRQHSFRTNSDTEVIAHLYEDKGVDCLHDLRGMFGAAIWDRRAQRLVVGRDRLGKKPLFYSFENGRLLFGSEIKSLLAADPGLAEVNHEAVLPYFHYGFIPEPGTMFKRIRKLPAGHHLVYENGSIRIAPYWQLSFGERDGAPRSKQQWIEELDALLEEAVRIRLMSEVPLGVFLSGGLDSSAITAYARKAGLDPLKTFTIGFDREEWDESPDAQIVADHLGTEHHVLKLSEHDLAADLPQTVLTLVRHFDEPFGDNSALPTYHVSKLAREHVTVILGGDGGDELFAGYTSNQGIKFAQYYQRFLPMWLGQNVLPRLAEGVANALPNGKRYGALRAAKVLKASSLPLDSLYFKKMSSCSDEVLSSLFSKDLSNGNGHALMYPSDVAAALNSDWPLFNKTAYADIRFGLLDDMLVKVDRMSMAHSLEVRSPLLDHRLVEFVAQMPPSLKLDGWQTKAILRDTIRKYLPEQIMRKRKQGFSVPLRDWLRNGLNEMVGEYLESSSGRLPKDMFDHRAVKNILRQHRNGAADHSPVIWLLLNYAAWNELYIQNSPPVAVKA